MNLPTELRLMVYDHHFSQYRLEHNVRRIPYTRILYSCYTETPALLCVCRRIAREAREFASRHRVMTLDMDLLHQKGEYALLHILLRVAMVDSVYPTTFVGFLPTELRFFHAYCVSLLDDQPVIRLRLVLRDYGGAQKIHLDNWVEALSAWRYPVQLQVVFVVQEGYPKRDWLSALKKMGLLESVDWGVHSTEGPPILGVD